MSAGKLGILDWGIGGLFALQMARAREPSLDLVYLSDAGNTPYGKQSRSELRSSVARACDALLERGATELLVACHSASTVAPSWAHGVLRPEAVPGTGRRVLVLGGARTIRSGRWRRLLEARGHIVQQRIAQPLSAHVEAGTHEGAEALADLRRILAPARSPEVVVLACTHYPAMAGRIRVEVPGALLVDPAQCAVDALELRPGSGSLELLTTGPVERLAHLGEVLRIQL